MFEHFAVFWLANGSVFADMDVVIVVNAVARAAAQSPATQCIIVRPGLHADR